MSTNTELDLSTPRKSVRLDPSSPGPVRAGDTPWVPMGPGQAFKPIHFMPENRGYVAQLRLDPGTSIPPHRHSGEVHAFNLRGKRRLHTGNIVGPGDYVHEPAGNVDAWAVEGDETLVVLIVVEGNVDYLEPDGGLAVRFDARIMESAYRQFCLDHGLEALDLRA